MKYKLLALDMDGTLLNSQKKMSPRTADAIDELSKRGIYVVTSTGRNLAEILDYREVLRAMHFGILISGGMIFDFKKDTPVKVHGVDEEKILQVIDFGLAERAMIHLHTVRHSIAREDDIQHMENFGMGCSIGFACVATTSRNMSANTPAKSSKSICITAAKNPATEILRELSR